MLALAAAACALALGPQTRARLSIRARGVTALDSLEERVVEYTRVLSSLLKRRCEAADGCLVVDVVWEPPHHVGDEGLEIRLKLVGANNTTAGE